MTLHSVDVADIAAKLGLELRTVSDAQLDAWRRTDSVWESFYDWLVSEGCGDKSTMHGRCYVGDDLLKRLLIAQRKVLMRKHGVKRIDERVGWSNMGSGPMELYRGRRIRGDGFYVEPETPIQPFTPPVIPPEPPRTQLSIVGPDSGSSKTVYICSCGRFLVEYASQMYTRTTCGRQHGEPLSLEEIEALIADRQSAAQNTP